MSIDTHALLRPDDSLLARFTDGRLPHGVLAVMAHPDDETLGAGICLSRSERVSLVHLTDGAPRSTWFYQQAGCRTRAQYSLLRARELSSALETLALRPRARYTLGAVDQEAMDDFLRIFRGLCAVLGSDRYDVVVTHAYEGGHPDHDAAALLVHTAVARMRERRGWAPSIVEVSGYHAGADGELVTSRFLRRGQGALGGAGIEVRLTREELARKHRALACFGSQRAVVERFEVDTERFRMAPSYDFDAPPHDGTLHYEQHDWPMTGARFRMLARRARQRLTVLEPQVTWH